VKQVRDAHGHALTLDMPQRQRERVEEAYRVLTRGRRLPLTRRDGSAPGMALQDRDKNVIMAVHEFHYLTTTSVAGLLFKGRHTNRARERLQKLFHNGYLDRVFLSNENGCGRREFVYTLGPKGREVVADEEGCFVDQVPYGYRRQANREGHGNLRHALAVAEFKVALVQACSVKGAALEDWKDEAELKINGRAERVTDFKTGKDIRFLPDAYFQLRNREGRSACCFLEMDFSTLSHRRWRERIRAYHAYLHDGHFRRRFKMKSFRALVVTRPDYRKRSRRDNLMQTVRGEGVDGSIFLFTVLDDVCAEKALTSVWKGLDSLMHGIV